LSADIVAESKRAVSVPDASWQEISGKIMLQALDKNRALKRSIAAYEACRK
jgi:hypothetical protein